MEEREREWWKEGEKNRKEWITKKIQEEQKAKKKERKGKKRTDEKWRKQNGGERKRLGYEQKNRLAFIFYF